MIMFFAHLPLYFYCINIRYKGLKNAIESNDKESLQIELMLSVITLFLITFILYINYKIIQQ